MSNEPTENDGARTLTRAQLVREIAQLRGYRVEKLVALCRLHKPNSHTVTTACTLTADAWQVFENDLPQYLTDANAALELFEELPDGCIDIAFPETGREVSFSLPNEDPAQVADKNFEFVIHANLKVAICCAWYLWRTGQRIALSEESEATTNG